MIYGTVDLLYANTPSVVGHEGRVEIGCADHGEETDVIFSMSGVGGNINVLVGHVAAH